MLKYAPFAASSGILAAARDTPPLRRGAWSSAVKILQGALIDLGYALPRSVRKHGVPDGVFGQETFDVIQTFQTDRALAATGIAGRQTILELDRLLSLKAEPPAYIPPPPPVLPRTAHYELGTADPPMHPDKGAGAWQSRRISAAYIALRAAIYQVLPSANVLIGDDAVKHMTHYLGNTGERYTIDLEDMVRQVPSAKEALQAEAAQAQDFVEMLPAGKHEITSRTSEEGYNDKDENWNWYFATGGYQSWGKGTAYVVDTPKGREYTLDFEYKFFDRYNWDKGKKVKIFEITVTDEFMAEFHRQGLAREFDCVGSLRRHLTWKHGETLPASQFERAGDSRS